MVRRSIALAVLGVVLASCAPPPPVKIGFLAGLTGSASELGIGARRALELSVAEVNRSGGIHGRPLEVVVMDDGNEPSQGLVAFKQFQQSGVVAVVGPVASTVVGAIFPYLNQEHLLTISPTVSAASVAGLDDWFFRVIGVNRTMGDTLAAYALELGLDDIAVLRETSNDAYTRPIFEAFQAKLVARGRTVRSPVEFDLRRQPDYGALAQELGPAGAYLVLASGFDTAQIGQRLANAGHLQPLLAPPWAMTPDVITLGGRQVERMVFVSIYDSQSQEPAWLKFREDYLRLYGEEPGLSAIFTRDAFSLLRGALERTKSLSPDDLRAAVKSAGEVEGLQSRFQLDDNGDVVRGLYLLTVREGRFVRAAP